MIYAYVSVHYNRPEEVISEIEQYAASKGIPIDELCYDEKSNTVPWRDRDLYQLLNEEMAEGDVLVVYEASSIGRSTQLVLETLECVMQRGIVLHFVKYDQVFPTAEYVDTEKFLFLLQNIDSDFVSKRTTEAIAGQGIKRKAGRPKGKKNAALKLDRHREEIEKYLGMGISRASIAKLIGCHPQTLYSYIDKCELMSKDED